MVQLSLPTINRIYFNLLTGLAWRRGQVARAERVTAIKEMRAAPDIVSADVAYVVAKVPIPMYFACLRGKVDVYVQALSKPKHKRWRDCESMREGLGLSSREYTVNGQMDHLPI